MQASHAWTVGSFCEVEGLEAEGFAGAWFSAQVERAPTGFNGAHVEVRYAEMLDSDNSLLREKVQLARCVHHHAMRPAQPAHLLHVQILRVGLPVDVYSADIWWEGYLRCESVATADSPGEWQVFCHHTNDTVSVNVAAWEAELDGAPPADGTIRAGLSWSGGSWYHRPSMDGQEGMRLAEAADFQVAQPSRPVRRQLVADGNQCSSEPLFTPVATPLFTPGAIETLFLTRRGLQALLNAHGNDAAAVCRIIPGALVRTFDDPESAYASRLWIVASASVQGTAGSLASIELREAGSVGCSNANVLCNMAPTGHDVAALMALPAFAALTLGGCRDAAARLAAAQGTCAQSARSALQPADAASHAALAARYAALALPVFGSLSGINQHGMQIGGDAQPRRTMSASALLLRPCTFHRCRKVPAAMAFPRYCYYPPPPAERVPSGPFCVACLSQWSRQMQDNFGLWPEGGGPPASVTYGSVMRDARAAGALS